MPNPEESHDPYSELDRIDFKDGGHPGNPPANPNEVGSAGRVTAGIPYPGSNDTSSSSNTSGDLLGGMSDIIVNKPSAIARPNKSGTSATADVEAFILSTFPQLSREQQQLIIAQYIERLTKANDIKNEKEAFDLNKQKKLLNFQTWTAVIIIACILIFAATFIGIFVYISLENGVLAESGVFNGIAGTLKEVIKIIFTALISG